MKGSEANILCSHGGDMLAYLYNEMEGADRNTFEVHLSACGICIDDFAELSQSRFPVFEWKRIEFDPLPTPRVVVPSEATAVSWVDQIRTAISFRPTFAFGGIGAVMIIAVVTGYLILAGTSGKTEVALEMAPSSSPARSAVVVPPASAADTNTQASDGSEVREKTPKVVKASTPAKPTVRSQRPKPAQQPKRNHQIPVMSSIEDDEDDSLRLADIFEEIGTSE